MPRTVIPLIACALIASAPVAAMAQGSEAEAWARAKQDATSDAVFAFISDYPDGAFANEAKAYMIDLLWTELAAPSPEAAAPSPAAEPVTPVTFSAPLTDGAPEIVGMSLEELIAGSPHFPPVEGLPEEYWQNETCATCHEWQRENLCTQANTYLSDAGAENLVKQHPYGGTFKLNLRRWAQSGCE